MQMKGVIFYIGKRHNILISVYVYIKRLDDFFKFVYVLYSDNNSLMIDHVRARVMMRFR